MDDPTLLARSLSENSRLAYDRAWSAWSAWCAIHHAAPLPVNLELLHSHLEYLGRVKRQRPSTLVHRLYCVRAQAVELGFPVQKDKRTNNLMQNLARENPTDPRRAKPLLRREMYALCAQPMEGPRGRRDRALLLAGWFGTLRSSEIVALQWRDVAFRTDHVGLVLRRTKGKQFSSVEVRLPLGLTPHTCPRAALLELLAADTPGGLERPELHCFRRIEPSGPLNRVAVARIIKTRAETAGLGSAWSAHSLRRGGVTQAVIDGVPASLIRMHSRHASVERFETYVETSELPQRIATAGLL